MGLIHLNTATIQVGQTLSPAVSLGEDSLIRIVTPANLIGTSLSFMTSQSNITFADVYDDLGALYAIPTGPSRVHFLRFPIVGASFVKVKASLAQTGTPADIILVSRYVE